MKKYLFFILFGLLLSGNIFAQQDNFRTQGIPRAELQIQPEMKQIQSKALRSTAFTFDDIKFWVGEGENQAALVVDWYYNGETAMVWGYCWDGEASGLDMITAIAYADPNFLLLTQLTNLGNTIAGIGYATPRNKIELQYDLEGAKNDSRISFKFDNPNTFLGQTHCPTDPVSEIASALQNGILTGIIDHPFNYTNYGYACYDYDHWNCTTSGVKWQSAWYDGYWSYLVKDNISDEFCYSGLGATLRILSNGSWDAWGFQDGWDSWDGVNPREPYTGALPPHVAVTNISLSTNAIELTVNGTAQLIATIAPENASNENITWKSNNESVAIVSSNGLVTAKSSGSANIIATSEDGNFTATCAVTVTNSIISVTNVFLNTVSAELFVNETLQLIATITPANATNKNITWASDNDSVATVDANGLTTAIAEGSANIYVTTEDKGLTAYCNLSIKVNTTGISDITTPSHRIYPTLTDGAIYISMGKIELIQVIDITGRIVTTVMPKELDTTISLNSNNNGIYLIKTGNNVSKIIKR